MRVQNSNALSFSRADMPYSPTNAIRGVHPLDDVKRTALWCSLELIAHDRRPIDDDDAETIRRAAALIKAMR